MSHPFTDIVVPVHNANSYVRHMIETLHQNTVDFRLIIVDDYSDEPTREFLYGPDCLGRDGRNLYVRTNSQRWFTRASNLGLRLVRTERAVVLNSDCDIGVGWLEELHSIFDEVTAQGIKVGLVGSTMTNEDDPRRYEQTQKPNYVTGHCILLNMAAVGEIAASRGTPGWFFDETRQDSIHINSDRYICYDLNAIGYATIAGFKSWVGHHFAKSWGADLGRVMNLRVTDPISGTIG